MNPGPPIGLGGGRTGPPNPAPPNPGPPMTLGGPTGVTTPGLPWIPGVIGSASNTGGAMTLVVVIG